MDHAVCLGDSAQSEPASRRFLIAFGEENPIISRIAELAEAERIELDASTDFSSAAALIIVSSASIPAPLEDVTANELERCLLCQIELPWRALRQAFATPAISSIIHVLLAGKGFIMEAGAEALVRCAAIEVGGLDSRIRVNGVHAAPGSKAEDVAMSVLHLLSDDARFVTGTVVRLEASR